MTAALAEYHTGAGPACRVVNNSRPDLAWLHAGLCAWFDTTIGHLADPAAGADLVIDNFPAYPGRQEALDRLDAEDFSLMRVVEDLIAGEHDAWLALGLLVGAHLTLGYPLDAVSLRRYCEQAEAFAAQTAGRASRPEGDAA